MSYLALDSNAWQVSVKIKAPIFFAIKNLRNLFYTQFMRTNYMLDKHIRNSVRLRNRDVAKMLFALQIIASLVRAQSRTRVLPSTIRWAIEKAYEKSRVTSPFGFLHTSL